MSLVTSQVVASDVTRKSGVGLCGTSLVICPAAEASRKIDPQPHGPRTRKEVERLYHAALKCEEGDREAYLREVCAGDEELRREVESLLEQEGGAQSFLEAPALEEVARDLAQDRGQALS